MGLCALIDFKVVQIERSLNMDNRITINEKQYAFSSIKMDNTSKTVLLYAVNHGKFALSDDSIVEI